MNRPSRAPRTNKLRVTANINKAIFKEVYLKTFIMQMIIQADRKSDTIQFFYVNHHIDTIPAPKSRHKMSIPLTGIGPILQPFLKKL